MLIKTVFTRAQSAKQKPSPKVSSSFILESFDSPGSSIKLAKLQPLDNQVQRWSSESNRLTPPLSTADDKDRRRPPTMITMSLWTVDPERAGLQCPPLSNAVNSWCAPSHFKVHRISVCTQTCQYMCTKNTGTGASVYVAKHIQNVLHWSQLLVPSVPM